MERVSDRRLGDMSASANMAAELRLHWATINYHEVSSALHELAERRLVEAAVEKMLGGPAKSVILFREDGKFKAWRLAETFKENEKDEQVEGDTIHAALAKLVEEMERK